MVLFYAMHLFPVVATVSIQKEQFVKEHWWARSLRCQTQCLSGKETAGRMATRLDKFYTWPCFPWAGAHFSAAGANTQTEGSEGDHSIERRLIERKQGGDREGGRDKERETHRL